jgi:hypothetical protein
MLVFVYFCLLFVYYFPLSRELIIQFINFCGLFYNCFL